MFNLSNFAHETDVRYSTRSKRHHLCNNCIQEYQYPPLQNKTQTSTNWSPFPRYIVHHAVPQHPQPISTILGDSNQSYGIKYVHTQIKIATLTNNNPNKLHSNSPTDAEALPRGYLRSNGTFKIVPAETLLLASNKRTRIPPSQRRRPLQVLISMDSSYAS
jgi:hypothetical protein